MRDATAADDDTGHARDGARDTGGTIPRESVLTERDDGVTHDLMAKVADDVTGTLLRVLSIAPPPRLPILLTAAAAVLGMVSAELDHLSDGPAGEPAPHLIVLAALLAGRSGIDSADPVKEAYRDFEILEGAGRIPAAKQEGGPS